MHPSNSLFKVFCVSVVFASLVTISPQNISGKPIDLGNVTGDIIQVTGKIWQTMSHLNINLDLLKSIKLNFFENSMKQPGQDFQKVFASIDPSKDTVIKSPSGKITIKIPAGAVKKQTDIEIVEDNPQGEKSISLSTGSGKMFELFELSAKETVSKVAVTKFDKNLEISIQHTEEELAGFDTNSLKLYSYNEKNKQWEVVPDSKFDPKTKTLAATTDHFSTYGEQGNPQIVGPERIMASQVNLHSGTATFSYPLELPAAQGGFQPKLELSYNSGGADEMKDKKAVGSWVGIGWDFSLGQISYDATANKYYLDLNGASYELISTDGQIYDTNPASYYRVRRMGNKWTMLDREGYTYEFGGTADSRQYIDSDGTELYYRWSLNKMKDTNGNPAIIHYVQDIRGSTPDDWVRAAYPDYLRYGFTDPNNATTYKFEVVFNTATETDYGADGQLRPDNPRSYGYDPAPMVMENRRLSSVEVKAGGQSSTLLRRYDFNYTTTPCYLQGSHYYAGTMILNSITQIGSDGTSALPAMSFNYTNLTTRGFDFQFLTFSWPHLTQVNSGYGGTIGFSYTQIPSTPTSIWSREVVITKTINSGMSGNETYNYTYVGRISTSDPNPQYLGDWYNYPNPKFRGFEKVTETDAIGNYTQHYYYTTDGDGTDAEKLTGKEYETQYYDSNGNLLQDKVNTWSLTPIGTDNWFIKLDKAETTDYKVGDTNTKKTARTEYIYDDYGNVITEKVWGDTTVTSDNSIISRTYYPNTTTNILSKVATEKVYLAADDTFTVNEANLQVL